MVTRDEIAAWLDLAPLPDEGGRYRVTLADGQMSAIYFLLGADDASALHRLQQTELWHHYLGASVDLVILHPDGSVEHVVLGRDLTGGERPQATVPAGSWMGAISRGGASLMGCTLAPPYDHDGFELGDAQRLRRAYPAASELIDRIDARAA